MVLVTLNHVPYSVVTCVGSLRNFSTPLRSSPFLFCCWNCWSLLADEVHKCTDWSSLFSTVEQISSDYLTCIYEILSRTVDVGQIFLSCRNSVVCSYDVNLVDSNLSCTSNLNIVVLWIAFLVYYLECSSEVIVTSILILLVQNEVEWAVILVVTEQLTVVDCEQVFNLIECLTVPVLSIVIQCVADLSLEDSNCNHFLFIRISVVNLACNEVSLNSVLSCVLSYNSCEVFSPVNYNLLAIQYLILNNTANSVGLSLSYESLVITVVSELVSLSGC